jgi:hypothetical protein
MSTVLIQHCLENAWAFEESRAAANGVGVS